MTTHVNTIIVGGGQAGLSVSYFLAVQGRLLDRPIAGLRHGWITHPETRRDRLPGAVLRLSWLHNAKSGLIYGVGDDAAYLARTIAGDARSKVSVVGRGPARKVVSA